jgi:hypothetical protein
MPGTPNIYHYLDAGSTEKCKVVLALYNKP